MLLGFAVVGELVGLFGNRLLQKDFHRFRQILQLQFRREDRIDFELIYIALRRVASGRPFQSLAVSRLPDLPACLSQSSNLVGEADVGDDDSVDSIAM